MTALALFRLRGMWCYLLIPFLFFVLSLMTWQSCGAQVRDVITEQKVERLRQRDESLRTSIQGARIDRQAEISRLEGRIARLEKSLGRSSAVAGTSRFMDLVITLSQEFGPQSTDQLLSARTQDNATDAEPPRESADNELETGESTYDGKDAVDTASAEALPDQSQAGESLGGELGNPSTNVEENDSKSTARQRALRLIAEDYMASLKADLLDAKIELMENAASLMSLQRLTAKGLASAPQLELQKIRRQAAEARYDRLAKQESALRDLFPSLFPSPLPPPVEKPTAESQTEQATASDDQ